MLSKVEIRTEDGRVLELPIYDPEDYPVRDITGLDPVKANIVSSSYAQLDGSQYQAARRESRNIVLKTGLDADFSETTVRGLRKQLQSFASPKSHPTLRFFDDAAPTVDIDSYVESFDAPLFVSDPEATISFLCLDPDFRAINSITVNGNTVSTATDHPIAYEGDTDTGFVFKLLVNRTIDEFIIANTIPGGQVRALGFASPSSPLLNGDVLTISTVPGNKYARVLHSGVTSSILWGIDPTSDWLRLYPGVNNIRVAATGATIPWTIEYTDKFGGL